MDKDEAMLSETISSRVADRIREAILSRKISPGTRITVREISEKYSVSSMPVREAFNMLCGEGLLEMTPYKGATVVAISSEMIAQLNDLQYALESLLVELCVNKGYSEDILQQLDSINSEMASLKGDEWRTKRLGLNVKFHTIEYSPCANHMAYELFMNNLRRLAAIREHYEVSEDRGKQSVLEHHYIIQALRNRDIDSAVKWTKQHTAKSKEYALAEKFG